MPGIEDLMNIRTQGGTENAPPMPPQMGAGGPPMPPMGGGQPPMPPMGGGQPPMGAGGPPMDPGMGEMAMQGQEQPQEDPQMNMEQDSAMLAEAVVGRAQGDIGAAIAVLDNAKAMLMASVEGGQEPQMMRGGGYVDYKMGGGPMYANMGGELNPGLQALQRTNPEVVDQIMKRNMGGPMYANMGRPLYRQGGGSMSENDVLREMIMDNLQKPEIQQQAMSNVMGDMGGGMSKEQAMSDLMKFRTA
jgi:hypothetical protein|tara:strand:+ start:272 stop:1009 length:738 start_codon:yes stop_codon:yes gene_type:complete